MTTSAIPRGRLRRLAELRPQHGRVLSVFVDLDPAQFATGAARATQLTSLLDEAGRVADRLDDLDHDERVALREDIVRVRNALRPENLGAGGVRGLAIYACGPADMLEIFRLPHPVQAAVFVDHSPRIEPIATAGDAERWCVVLASRKDGRVFLGDEHGLEEIDGRRVQSDTHGQHDQGGWSQARFQRSVDGEKRDHLDRLAGEVFDVLRTRPFDRLLVGGPEPLDSELEGRLHPYLEERLAGRVQVDVENVDASAVLRAAVPVFEEHQRAREREALERLRAGWRREGGRAAAGVPEVLAALNEQRVEVLLIEPRASAHGWVDPATGFLAADPGASPTGGELQERDDVLEAAVEKAIEQAAGILVIRHHLDLGVHGGVAALLRY